MDELVTLLADYDPAQRALYMESPVDKKALELVNAIDHVLALFGHPKEQILAALAIPYFENYTIIRERYPILANAVHHARYL
jgi:hypothetical protein